MPFRYPHEPHVRKHGPRGYDHYSSYKDWLRDEFTFRCVYCLTRERWYPNGHGAFGVDHIKPKGDPRYVHLENDCDNLLYACNRCNSDKGAQIVPNPCTIAFAEHVRVNDDGSIEALSTEGRELIYIFRLDDGSQVEMRRNMLRLVALFERYPTDPEVQSLYLFELGFPDQLPDLNAKRCENSKPEGVGNSYFQQRNVGELPATY
jgi:hypothetical protein